MEAIILSRLRDLAKLKIKIFEIQKSLEILSDPYTDLSIQPYNYFQIELEGLKEAFNALKPTNWENAKI